MQPTAPSLTVFSGTDMKQVISTLRCIFLGFFRNSRTIVTFLISVVLCFLLSSRVTELIARYGTSVQAVEPFLWTFGDSTSILLISLMLVFLFSDLPKITPFTPFCLVRITRRKWLAAQLLYITAVTCLYIGFVLAVTILLCMKHTFPQNLWSETAAILGYSSVGAKMNIPSTVKIMESISPCGCMLQVCLLMLGYSLTLGFLILTGNLLLGAKSGMVLALLYSLYGFLLDPDVLGNLLGLEKHELYRVRSIVGWISPLNHAVYQMHDFGYDNLPTIAQSMGCFALFILPCILLSVHTLKRYSFSFLGS